MPTPNAQDQRPGHGAGAGREAMQKDVNRRLRRLAGRRVGQGATFEEILLAEAALGVVLSDSYRAFVREFGWGGAPGWELFGLGPDVPFHLDLVGVTTSERNEPPRLPHHLVPLMSDGADNRFCLDTSRRSSYGEAPVVFWEGKLGEGQAPDEVAPDFLSWLSRLVARSSRR